jgi:hypothetical protein
MCAWILTFFMARGRPPKNKYMLQQTDVTKLPVMEQGDVITLHLEISRVSNGYIVKGWDESGKESLMVFNGQDPHRSVTGHVLDLALADMQPGEIITYNSKMTYTKKIQI